jgi:aspartate oxidase
MSRKVGILRSGIELQEARSELTEFGVQLDAMSEPHATDSGPANELVKIYGETQNRLLVARLITLAALRREESRGAHHRSDFPTAKLDWQRHQAMTVEALLV